MPTSIANIKHDKIPLRLQNADHPIHRHQALRMAAGLGVNLDITAGNRLGFIAPCMASFGNWLYGFLVIPVELALVGVLSN